MVVSVTNVPFMLLIKEENFSGPKIDSCSTKLFLPIELFLLGIDGRTGFSKKDLLETSSCPFIIVFPR